MSFNLLDAAKSLFSSDLVTKASAYLGESETGIKKALSGILPSVFGGLLEKTSSNNGAQAVAQVAQEQHGSGTLDNLGGFFSNDGSGLIKKGEELLSGLFGDKLSALHHPISNFSGVKPSSVSSLISMAAPAVLALIGKHNPDNNSGSVSGVTSLLNSQKKNIAAAMPSGLNLSSVLGLWNTNLKTAVAPAADHIAAADKSSGMMKILLPILLLILAAMAAWYLFGKGCNKKSDAAIAGSDSLKANTEQTIDNSKSNIAAVGKVDSVSGDFIYELGQKVTIDLPNGAGKLEVGENSTENKLCKFLANPDAKLDTVKGNWFEFTNVHFKTGGAIIDDSSMAQLKNMAAITKGYPSSQFKLGGYTDNTGNAASNVALSQKRADAVAAMLKKLGVNDHSIAGAKGYGPEWPIGDNATVEGRAMNRRVAVNVKAK